MNSVKSNDHSVIHDSYELITNPNYTIWKSDDISDDIYNHLKTYLGTYDFNIPLLKDCDIFYYSQLNQNSYIIKINDEMFCECETSDNIIHWYWIFWFIDTTKSRRIIDSETIDNVWQKWFFWKQRILNINAFLKQYHDASIHSWIFAHDSAEKRWQELLKLWYAELVILLDDDVYKCK